MRWLFGGMLVSWAQSKNIKGFKEGILDHCKKGCPEEKVAQIAKNSFFLSRLVDATRAGVNNPQGLYYDCEQVLHPWPYQVTNISPGIPVLIVHGHADDTVSHMEGEWNSKEIKHAKLCITNDGHMSITFRLREDLLNMVGML